MDKYEQLKSRIIHYSIELTQKKLSSTLLEDLYIRNEILKKSKELQKVIESEEDLKQLKKYIKQNKSLIGKELFDECLEEIRTIKQDLKFINSKEGKAISKLEDWVISVRPKFENFKNSKLFVGRSNWNPKDIIIGGLVQNEETKKDIISLAQTLSPPVKIIFFIEIEKLLLTHR